MQQQIGRRVAGHDELSAEQEIGMAGAQPPINERTRHGSKRTRLYARSET
jgi:hypothetical protein